MKRFIRFWHYLRWGTLKKTITYAMQRRLNGLAAEMAFSAMLGLFPAILAILTAISFFEQSLESYLGDLAIRFAEIVPDQVWQILLNFTRIRLAQGTSWFSLSFVAAIWIFSGALGAAMNALDQIHQVPRSERRPFWQAKLISILLTIGTIILLIFASFFLLIGEFVLRLAIQQNWGELLLFAWQFLTVVAILAIVGSAIFFIDQVQKYLSDRSQRGQKQIVSFLLFIIGLILVQIIYSFYLFVRSLIVETNIEQTVISLLINVWRLLSFPIALAIVAIAFAFVYRFGTSRWRKGTPIMPGAILAAISWAIVSNLFRLYVTHFGQYNQIYGAVGAVIVLMLWLYLSCFVMLLGDQLNAAVEEAMNKKLKNRPSSVYRQETMHN
ncbi:YihY/virulence factor BrkB family protein [Pleurocapsales cyanobacterium LEGE 06147]|nr:YihY/virulence factor BrkB family protein [Pleurocapsales cyanobacterium LEGE 06147]